MPEYEVDCHECEMNFTTDDEEEAVGWMFGHNMSSGHEDITKSELD